ncbi:MAG: DevR family CRISPR-associated autoregulator [Desulfurococcales archaeon]|nr:DevR family CRISPR-associated autoregulator [Desulfurococcales archaeon]
MKSESVSLGVSFRVLVNQESLNMAESVGNVTRHRKAPIVVRIGGAYKLIYVPVVSGMSLAHHYQRHLARAAHDMDLNVTRMSLLGYFMKFADDKIIKSYYPEVAGKVDKKRPCESERAIVEACTVADVGGFLYTDGLVKRTSRFSFSYLVPALDAVEQGAVGSTPQLHVRFTPGAGKGEQVPFYNDNSSALYTATFLLEVDGISRLDVCHALTGEPASLGKEEQLKRFEASVKALIAMLGNLSFGAKRTRNLPHWRIQSAVVTGALGVSPFVPSSGHSNKYILETLERAEAQKKHDVIKDYTIAVYNAEDLEQGDVKTFNTLEEAVAAVAAWIKKNYFSQ